MPSVFSDRSNVVLRKAFLFFPTIGAAMMESFFDKIPLCLRKVIFWSASDSCSSFIGIKDSPVWIFKTLFSIGLLYFFFIFLSIEDTGSKYDFRIIFCVLSTFLSSGFCILSVIFSPFP